MLVLIKLTRVVFVALLSLALLACSSNDTEEEKGPAPLVDFEKERVFKKVWSHSVGNGQGGIFNRLTPAIDGEHIYAASADGYVKAIMLNNSKKQWRVNLDRPLVGGVGVGEKALFVGAASGDVIALDKLNGDVLWEMSVGGEVLSPPQADDSRVYVQTFDGQLLALDVNDGSRVWSYRSTLPVLTLRGTSTPLLYRDAVITGFANGRILSFDRETGAIKWNSRVSVAKGDSEIQRIIDVDGAIFEDAGIIYAVSYQGRITAFDPDSGRRRWSNEESSYVGMSMGFGNIYVSSEGGDVTAYEKNGQDVRWSQTLLARRKLTGSVTLSSYVIVGDAEGYLHAMSQVDGHIAARTKVDSDGLQVDLQTYNDMIIVYSNDGRLEAYTLDEPTRGWF